MTEFRGYALNCFEVRCTGFFHIMENRISTLSNSSHSKMKDASPWYPPVPAPRLKPGEATEAFISNIAEAEAGSEKQKNLILFLLSQILHHHHHLAAGANKKVSVWGPPNLTFSSSARRTHVIRAAEEGGWYKNSRKVGNRPQKIKRWFPFSFCRWKDGRTQEKDLGRCAGKEGLWIFNCTSAAESSGKLEIRPKVFFCPRWRANA